MSEGGATPVGVETAVFDPAPLADVRERAGQATDADARSAG
ncbi:hypothetical protein [Jatrophihabitans sp. GAS493]|nr:hypothetical protein [Jatrophihabitans sp. GAS493]